MIDVSELLSDPDFAQPFTIQRTTGGFANEGEYSTADPTDIPAFGVIQPASSADMVRFLPEGERQKNTISIWSPVLIQMADGQGQESDVIIWQGQYYRVAFSKPWQTQGYWFAMAVGFAHA